MCGITGAVSPAAVDRLVVARMRDTLAHRGPDAAGLWTGAGGRVCLGHRRLTIVDPSPEANQPFVSADGRLALVLNGEIYNFRSLRSVLERRGARFRTRSDTEVLLEAYRHWGAACLDRLSGMFAFALWDEEQGGLFCARDRAGEKPFYYATVDGTFLFASELKALLAWPGFPRRLDAEGVVEYLSLGYVPDPRSIWKDASKLPPGHALQVDLRAGEVQAGEPRPYWEFEIAADAACDDWGSEIRSALSAAADEMAYADVPVGAFLSGGVDSSAVVAALANAGRDVRAFSIGFEEDAYDERPFAREVATRYAAKHEERVVRVEDVERVLLDVVLFHFDEPFADYSYLPTYYVSREARRSITVALTGDGADEIFAGYPKYALAARRDGLHRRLTPAGARAVAAAGRAMLPRPSLRARLSRYACTPPALLADTLTTGILPEVVQAVARGPIAALDARATVARVIGRHLRAAPPEEVGIVNAMRYLDLKLTLGSGILTKVDRASMAVSLETRPVFLHRHLLDLAARIPAGTLADARSAKRALRDAVRPWLPAVTVDRPKQGFAMPLGSWLRGDLAPMARRIVSGPVCELVEPSFVAAIVDDHVTGATDRTRELHTLLFLNHWLERWS